MISTEKDTRRILWLCIGEYKGRTIRGLLAYTIARIEQHSRDALFQYYVTDYLLGMFNIMHQYFGGAPVEKRFYDEVNKLTKPQKTNQEIFESVIKNAGIIITA